MATQIEILEKKVSDLQKQYNEALQSLNDAIAKRDYYYSQSGGNPLEILNYPKYIYWQRQVASIQPNVDSLKKSLDQANADLKAAYDTQANSPAFIQAQNEIKANAELESKRQRNLIIGVVIIVVVIIVGVVLVKK